MMIRFFDALNNCLARSVNFILQGEYANVL